MFVQRWLRKQIQVSETTTDQQEKVLRDHKLFISQVHFNTLH